MEERPQQKPCITAALLGQGGEEDLKEKLARQTFPWFRIGEASLPEELGEVLVLVPGEASLDNSALETLYYALKAAPSVQAALLPEGILGISAAALKGRARPLEELYEAYRKGALKLESPGSLTALPEFGPFPQWSLPGKEESGKVGILMILPFMVLGGADLFNLNLLRGLDQDRFKVYVFTTYPAAHTLGQEFREAAAGVYELPVFLPPEAWPSFTRAFLESHGISILFASNTYYAYESLPWLRETLPELRVVDYVHGEFPWRGGAYARTSALFDPWLDRTYVCNRHTQKRLGEAYGKPEEKVETLYIGVDHERFNPEKISRGTLRKELGIPAEKKLILLPCRMEGEKRPLLFLEIAAAIKSQRGEDYVFAAVGEGSFLPAMREKAIALGLGDSLILAGMRRDMPQVYRDAQATVICSLTEGLSLTAYESLAMGVPCITADVGGQKELVDGETGAVIPCSGMDPAPVWEVEAYAEAILTLTRDRKVWKEASLACRRKILEGFTQEAMIRSFEAIFLNPPEKAPCPRLGTVGEELLTQALRGEVLEWSLEEMRKAREGSLPQRLKQLLKRIAGRKA